MLTELSALTDSVNIGDTIAAPAVQLSVNGAVVPVEFRATVTSGSGMAILPDGRLAVLGPGDATVRVRAVSAALPPDTVLEATFTLHAVVPRLTSTGPDTLYSIGDTAQLATAALSRTGAPLAGIPVAWTVVAGDTAVQLVDAATGRFLALKNGDAELRAVSDTATTTRTLRVRQRAASVDPDVATATLRSVGQTWQLSAQVLDARLNTIAGAGTTWTSRDGTVATVSGSGLVTATGEGATWIVVSSTVGGGQSTDSVRVIVERARIRAASATASLEQASIGQNLPAPFEVQLVNAANADLPDSGVTVTFSVVSGDGTFGGSASATVTTDATGRARATLTLGVQLDDDSVSVSGPGLAGTPLRFAARPAQPARLRFGAQPTATLAGAVITPPPTVTVRDTFGTLLTSFAGQATVALDASLATGGTPGALAGAQLLGSLTRPVVNGVATYNDLTPDQVGQGFRLAATSGALQPDTSQAFNVAAGAAAKLAFSRQPMGGIAGQALALVEVTVLDAFDNPVVDYVGDVTLSIGTVPAGGANQLFGTTAVAVAGGIAPFTDLVLPVPADGYRLRAAATGLPSVLSAAFAVSGVPDTIVSVSGNNQSALVGQPLAQPFVVAVRTQALAPVVGDTVVFRRTTNDGSFNGADTAWAVTDALGRASAQLTFAGSVPGNFAVTAQSRSLPTQTVTFDFSVSPVGLALEFTTQPSDGTGGTPLSPAVVVRITDGAGNTQTTSNAFVTLAVEPGSGTAGAAVTGTATVQAVAGVATFSGIGVDSAGTGYRLSATSAGITSATSAPFAIATGPAAALRFRAGPQSGVAGAALATFTAAVTDAGGNLVTGHAGDVTLVIAPGSGPAGATLRGTVTRPLVGGIATFDDVSIDSSSAAYALQAPLAPLATALSAAFTIQPAPPVRLAFLGQPATVTAGRVFAAPVSVAIQDSLGNLVTTGSHSVTVSLQPNPTGGSLLGTATVAAVNGVATFATLRVREAGAGYGLSAGAAGLTGAASVLFQVDPAPPARLAFTVQPTDASPGVAIAPAVVVAVRDSLDNLVTSAAGSVTVAITGGTGTGGAILAGTATRAPSGGLATYTDLAIDLAGTDYTLTATSSSLTPAISAPFSVLTAASNRLVFAASPAVAEAGAPFAPVVTVQIQDGSGAVLTGRSDSVFVAITGGTGPAGATLRGMVRVAAVNGVATLPGLSIDSAGAGYRLTATAAGASALASATSAAFAVTPAPPSRLIFRVGPSSRTAGSPFSPPLEIAVVDSLFNVVTTATTTVSVGIAPGSGTPGAALSGTASRAAVAGIATFTDVAIDSAGVGYQLNALATGLTPALSGSFAITVGPLATITVTPAGLALSGGTGALNAVGKDAGGNIVTGLTFTFTSLNPAVATVSATGVATPVGSGQTAIAVSSGGITAWAAVVARVAPATAVNLWVPVTAPGGADLNDVWGSGPSDVWAAGAGGAVYHYDGAAWSAVTSPTTEAIRALWGFGPTNAWAATVFGRVLRWTGTTWSSVLNPGTSLIAGGAGATPDAHWMVGANGSIETFDGTSRALATSNTTQSLSAVWVASASDAIAVGGSSAGTAVHWDGATWTPRALAGTLQAAVHGFSPTNVFAVAAGNFHRWDGGSWNVLPAPGVNTMFGLWGPDPDELWATGVFGQVWRWNGAAWTQAPALTNQTLRGIWGTTAGDVWVVGDGGTILRGVRGATLTVDALPVLPALGATASAVATARDAAPTVVAGVTLTWTSRSPTVATVHPTSGLVTAVANGQAWLVAAAPGGVAESTLVTVAQSATRVAITPGSAMLSAVGATTNLTAEGRDANFNLVPGASFAWSSGSPAIATVHAATGVVTAVGAGQVIITASSGAGAAHALITVSDPGLAAVNLWTPEPSNLGTISTITSFWGADPADVWAGATGGSNLLRNTGTGWVVQGQSGTKGIWGSSATDIFRVNGGTISHYDGTSWQVQLSIGNISFTDIWGSAPNNVFAVGSPFGGGVATVYRYDGSSWTPMATPVTGSAGALTAIHGFAANDVYAVGSPGAIRFDGATWQVFPDPNSFLARDIWGTSPTNMFIPTGGGIYRWDGNAWTLVQPTAGTHGQTVWGTSPTDIYVAGDHGAIWRWNGTAFSRYGETGSGITLGALGGPGGATVLVGGDDATILRGYRGATVTVAPAAPTLTALGATVDLDATVRTALNVVVPTATIVWASRSLGVASVDAVSGVVTAVANGTAWIVATAPGGAAESTLVTVTQQVATVVVTPGGAALNGAGATADFGFVGRDARANLVAGAVAVWRSYNPAVAAVDAAGQVTAVAGGQSTIAAVVGGVSGYATVSVAAPQSPAVNLWAPVGHPAGTEHIAAFATVSATEAYALTTAGTLMRWNGTSWNVHAAATGPFLFDVWAQGPDTVIGVGGDVVRAASAWLPIGLPGALDLRAVWGLSHRDFFVIDDGGDIQRYNGSTWSQSHDGSTQLRDLFGTGRDSVVAVGAGGLVLRYNGATWTSDPTGVSEVLEGVWSSGQDLFVVGEAGRILRHSGGWSTPASGVSATLRGVSGSDASDVYAVGDNGTITWFDGAIWTPLPSGVSANLLDVAVTPAGDVFVGGEFGTLLRGYRGGRIIVAPNAAQLAVGALYQPSVTIQDAASNPLFNVPVAWTSLAAGVASVHPTTGQITAVSPGTTAIIATAAGGAADTIAITVAAVGQVALTPGGASLSGGGAQTSVTVELRDVGGNPLAGLGTGTLALACSSRNAAVATAAAAGATACQVTAIAMGQTAITATVGAATGHAVVTVLDPTLPPVNVWAPVNGTSAAHVQAIWGTGPGNVVAAGAPPNTVQRFQGGSWQAVPGFGGGDFQAIAGTGPADVLVASLSGFLERFDGMQWTPLAAGSNTLGMWAAAPDRILLAGANIVRVHDGAASAPALYTDVNEILRDVWGTGVDDAWIVGSDLSNTSPVLLRYDGGAVTPVSIATAAPAFEGVWAGATDLAFAVGHNGVVARWDGFAWADQSTGTGNTLYDVWGSSATDVYAVGSGGTLLRYNGIQWSPVTAGVAVTLNAVWGSGSDVWIGGDNGTLLRGYRGAAVVITTPPPTLTALGPAAQPLAAVARDASLAPISNVTITWSSLDVGTATVDPATGLVTALINGSVGIVATAPGGAADTVLVTVAQAITTLTVAPTAVQLTGIGNTATLSFTARDANGFNIDAPVVSWSSANAAVAGVHPSTGQVTAEGPGQAVIAVSVNGSLAYTVVTVADPALAPVTVWAPVTTGASGALRAVWGTSSTNVYVAGDAMPVLRFDGNQWSPEPSGALNLEALWGTGAGNLWGAGFSGVSRRAGGIWSQPLNGHHLGGWSPSPLEAFVAQAGGPLRHFDGTSWHDTVPGGAAFNALWGSGADDVHAVGAFGMVFRYTGGTWVPLGSPGGNHLNDVWGAAPNAVFAAGINGTIARYDGAAWSTMTSGTTHYLDGIGGTSANDVYAVGLDGIILRFDGTAWDTMPRGTNALLTDVWAAPDGAVYVTGESGTLLRGYRNASLVITTAPPTLGTIGGTVTLAAEARDAGAVLIPGVVVRWHSLQPAVATVDAATGIVTAVGNGVAGIVATAAGGAADTVQVTVQQVAATVTVSPSGVALTVGGSANLTAVVRDSGGTIIAGATPTWGTLNAAVASASNGMVSGNQMGQTSVVAQVSPATGFAVVTVSSASGAAFSSWNEISSGGATYRAVHSLQSDEAMLAGDNGTLVRYSAGVFTPVATGVTQNLNAVWSWGPPGGGQTWAVGDGGVMVLVNGLAGGTVTVYPPLSGHSMLGVWGSAPDDVYAVGNTGRVNHWNGSSWSIVTGPPTSDDLLAIWGAARDSIYVATFAQVYRFNGTTWTALQPPTSDVLQAIHGTGPEQFWTAGTTGAAWRYNAGSWESCCSSGSLTAVFSQHPVMAYVAGQNRPQVWQGSWNNIAGTATAQGMWGIHGAGTVLFIVGTGGLVFRGTP